MAGAPWRFSVLPSTITEVTVTDGTTTVTLQKESLPGGKTFSTSSFAETSSVTVSATGYASKTATVGDAVVDLTPYVSSITRSGITYQLKDAAATTALTTKADTDLSNVTNTGKSTGAMWAMPSSTYVDLTLGASGTSYTAPANGWVKCTIDVSANGWLDLNSQWVQASNASGYVSVFRPFQKGETFYIEYRGLLNVVQFRFYYAEGSKSEAN